MEEYQTFWDDLVRPAYEAQLEGVQLRSLYGRRGVCEGCIGMMITIESEEIRDKYMNADGSMNDYCKKKLARIQFVLDELSNRYGTSTTAYTDWIFDPDWDKIDEDDLSTSLRGPAWIKGTWALIHGEYSGKVKQGEVFQYKMFGDTHFSLNMKDAHSGKWDRSGIGKYSLDGDIFTESFIQSSDEQFTGVSATWRYRLEGDTLHMDGPLEIMDKDGKPAYQNLLNTMKEVRIKIE